MICIAWGPERVEGQANRHPEEWTWGPNTRPSNPAFAPLYRWHANKWDEAVAHFNSLRKNGIPNVQDPKAQAPTRLWRFRGFPSYLTVQAQRMRMPDILIKRTLQNKQMHDLSVSLASVSETAVKMSLGGLTDIKRNQLKMALEHAEDDVSRLHMLAAAAAAAVDEARVAYGLEPYQRSFHVHCEFDTAESNGHSTKKVQKVMEPKV